MRNASSVFGALPLLHLAAEGARAEAPVGEAVGDVGRVGAGADEDQRALARGEQEQVDEHRVALARADHVRDVRDVLVGLAALRALHVGRVALVAVGEREHLARKGGRHEVGAALGRRLAEDGLELVAEAEIEHLIGLVEDDGIGAPRVDRAALEMVEEPTRACRR